MRRRWNTLTDRKLVDFIERNPGLTASMIARLWQCRCGTVSSRLYHMTRKGLIVRYAGVGEWSKKTSVWRYYPDGAKQAMDELLAKGIGSWHCGN